MYMVVHYNGCLFIILLSFGPVNRKKQGKYVSGDQIHFIITGKFEGTANEFADYCEENCINFSEAIRRAMTNWLEEKQHNERSIELLKRGTSSMKKFADDYEREVFTEV